MDSLVAVSRDLLVRVSILLKTSLEAERFPVVGDSIEVWYPKAAAGNLLSEINNVLDTKEEQRGS